MLSGSATGERFTDEQEKPIFGVNIMALTREFRTTVLKRAQIDADFRHAMIKEGIDTMLTGDVEAGKAILRDSVEHAHRRKEGLKASNDH